ncbi:MAG: riboflavin synthase [Alphaproteobacteria bacterium]
MFSGIIEDIGIVESFDKKNNVLSINTKLQKIKIGESISCAGVCLTVSKKKTGILSFNLSKETLIKSNIGTLVKGSSINIEKSLKIGQEISGHFVFGHVDGLSKIKRITKVGQSWIFLIESDAHITKYLSSKCSISLDGVSLTVNNLKKKSFEVCIIPHTWENTTLQLNNVGDFFNTEIDMLARYVFKALNK